MQALYLRLRHRFFHFLFLFTRPMTLGARVMLFNAQGEICLIKHSYVAGWQLPGGGVDHGETIETAAIRELAEEAGYKPTEPMSLFAAYKNEHASKRDHVLLYICRAAEPLSGFKVDGQEIVDCQFFAADRLPDDITGSAKRRIAEVVGGVKCNGYW